MFDAPGDKIFSSCLIIINRDYYTSSDIVIGEHVFLRNDHDVCMHAYLPTLSAPTYLFDEEVVALY